MAAPSESFKWLLFGDAPHRCWRCGKEPLRVKDVAEHRHKYRKDEFLCRECAAARVKEMEGRHRESLGLEARP